MNQNSGGSSWKWPLSVSGCTKTSLPYAIEKHPHEFVMREEVRNDVVCAYADQPAAFPIVDFAALRLPRRHADGRSPHQLYFLDLHVTVAEDYYFPTPHICLRENALDQDLFGKALIIIQRTV